MDADKLLIVAEVKLKSPYGYLTSETFESRLSLADEIGDWVSIHTDSRWGGSVASLSAAQHYTQNDGRKRPILAKGIHPLDSQIEDALAYGADAVLVVGRLPSESLLSHCWLEPLNLDQLMMWAELPVPIVWNRRCLSTGGWKDHSHPDGWVHARRLAPSARLVCASGFTHVRQVPSDAFGVIVGEHLPGFAATLKTLNI